MPPATPAPPAVAPGGQPAAEEYMELEARRAAQPPAHDPLVEGCALWLEEAYPGQSQEARRALISAFHTACPAVWQTHRAGTGPPSPRVRRELRALAKRKGWEASSSSEDEPSDDAFAGDPSGRRRRGGKDLAPVDATTFADGPSGWRRRGGQDQAPGDAACADGPSGRRHGASPAPETPREPRQAHRLHRPTPRPPSSRRRRPPGGVFSAHCAHCARCAGALQRRLLPALSDLAVSPRPWEPPGQ